MSEENSTYSCVFCSARFGSKETLREHFREHANDREYSNNLGKRKKGFKGHIIDDTSGFKCDICGLTCRSKALLIVHHTRKHPEEAKTKYICSYCGRQFPLKMDWDNHVNLEHSEIKRNKSKSVRGASNFICEFCNSHFFGRGALELHKSTNHRMSSIFGTIFTPPPSNKIRVDSAGFNRSVYYCHLCGTEYINKYNLRKHLEQQHCEKERNRAPSELIKCNFCSALFFNIKAYETHNLSHNPNDHIVDGEYQRLETVSHTDLDFDFRRVRTNTTLDKLAQKEIRSANWKRKKPAQIGNLLHKKSAEKADDDEELSPPSDYGSSSDEAEET